MKPQAQTEQLINTCRGKALVGHCSTPDVKKLVAHIDALERLLDEADCEDVFGTEGWRHYMGIYQ